MNKVCYVAPSAFAASRHHVRNREPIKMQSAILNVTFPNHLLFIIHKQK